MNIVLEGVMQTTPLWDVGGSVMLAVPAGMLETLGLGAGDAVGLSVENGRMVVAPQRGARYALVQLLTQCDESADMTDEDRDWVGGWRRNLEPSRGMFGHQRRMPHCYAMEMAKRLPNVFE